MKYPVHEGGFIRLVDSMGDDRSVVKAARVSYNQESKGEDADKKLINYLAEHKHGTPFEHIVFTFHIRCPIFVARQWFRHRIGSFNEISGRYVKLETDFFKPTAFRQNHNENHQASIVGDFTKEETERIMQEYEYALDIIRSTYESLLSKGVAREQARAILPVGTYTEFYWTVNARSLFNFLVLRTDKNAQQEIRDYAKVIKFLAEDIAPWSFEAFRLKENFHNLKYQ